LEADARRFFVTKRGVVLVTQDMLRQIVVPVDSAAGAPVGTAAPVPNSTT
jgi:hypothetical protein